MQPGKISLNQRNGLGKTGGSGEVWHYKIVWVGPTKWDVSGQWSLDFNFGADYPHTIDYKTVMIIVLVAFQELVITMSTRHTHGQLQEQLMILMT